MIFPDSAPFWSVLFWALAAVCAAAFAACVVLTVLTYKKSGNTATLICGILTLAAPAVAGATYIISYYTTGVGMIRLITTVMSLPLLYTAAFLLINCITLRFADRAPMIRVLAFVSCAVYVLFFLLFSDYDQNGGYLFFGTVRNIIVTYILFILWGLLPINHFSLMIIQAVEAFASRSKPAAGAPETAENK